MIFYVWIWYTSMDIWYLKGAMQIAAKTTAPLQRLLQLVRNEPLKILKSLKPAIHWRIRPLLLSSASPTALCFHSTRKYLNKSRPDEKCSLVFCLLTMSHYVTLCHYVAQIGSDRHWLRLAQRLSDVGVPHDDGKVGVRVDGRHVGVQRVYERPGSIPAMVFQSCSTLNENIYKHHQKVYKKENLWSSPSWTALSHWLSGAPNIFPRCSETTTTQP